eukprot:2290745-Amphidinium_carterae.1
MRLKGFSASTCLSSATLHREGIARQRGHVPYLPAIVKKGRSCTLSSGYCEGKGKTGKEAGHVPYLRAIVKGEKDRDGHVHHLPAMVKGRSCTSSSGYCEGKEWPD